MKQIQTDSDLMVRAALAAKALDQKTALGRVKNALGVLGQETADMPDNTGFMSEKDAMLELGSCSRSTIWNYRKNLGLRSWKIAKGRRLYSKEEIQKFVERVGTA